MHFISDYNGSVNGSASGGLGLPWKNDDYVSRDTKVKMLKRINTNKGSLTS